MAGVPARRIGWVCACGQALTLEDVGGCPACGRRYREVDADSS